MSGPELSLTFDSGRAERNSAGAVLDTKVVTRNGGAFKLVGGAARLPAFQRTSPPQAALTVVDRQGVDDLDPDTADFAFGAAFTLDQTSEGSSSDNGNNLLQRGLHGGTTQYKLQVDGMRPSCWVKGRSGAVTVSSSRQVRADAWYRATCTRSGSTVTLTVQRLADGERWTYRKSGRTGSLTPSSRTVPLSIGAKVSGSGSILGSDSDQFNGRVDSVFLRID